MMIFGRGWKMIVAARYECKQYLMGLIAVARQSG
jgi:hypothetical protein